MNRRGPTLPVEVLLYVVLLAGAALVRWARLDWPPLNDAEAAQALPAAWEAGSIPRPTFEPADTAPQSPAYHALTTLTFEIMPTSDASARLVPTLAGLALVAVPLLMRGAIGPVPTLITAALLAFTAFPLTASRTAGGLSIAMAGATFAIALVAGRRANGGRSASLWAAAGLGVMLASGPSAFGGMLGLALGIGIARLIWRDLALPGWGATRARTWQLVLVAAIAGVGLACGFGFVPGALSGISESLTAWLAGWASPSPAHALTVLLSLPIYAPLLLVFGVAGAVMAVKAGDALGRLALAWFLGALVVALVYPGRQVGDLAWAAIPLAFLSARSMAAVVEGVAQHWTWQGHGAVVFVLLLLGAMAMMQVAGYASGIGPAIATGDPNLSLALASIALLLGFVIVALFGMGWSWPTALEGAGLSWLVILLVFDVSAAWSLNFRATAAGANELWRPQGTPQSLTAVRETIERLSQARTGRTDALPIDFLTQPPPSLTWALRRFPTATTGEGDLSPEVVLAADGTDLSGLRADYIGQRVIVGEIWGWDGILPPDTIAWWAHHEGPAVLDPWLLLVRVDVATLGGLTELPAETP